MFMTFYSQVSENSCLIAEISQVIVRTEYYNFQNEQDLCTFYETGIHIHRPCST